MGDPLARVRDLMRLATDESAPAEEARTAAITAVRLIAKHGFQVTAGDGTLIDEDFARKHGPPQNQTRRSYPNPEPINWEDLKEAAERFRNNMRAKAQEDLERAMHQAAGHQVCRKCRRRQGHSVWEGHCAYCYLGAAT